MYIYPGNPAYNSLKRSCRKSGDNFATHDGVVYEHVTTVKEPYFKAIAAAPIPEAFDHDINPSLYMTGIYDPEE